MKALFWTALVVALLSGAAMAPSIYKEVVYRNAMYEHLHENIHTFHCGSRIEAAYVDPRIAVDNDKMKTYKNLICK